MDVVPAGNGLGLGRTRILSRSPGIFLMDFNGDLMFGNPLVYFYNGDFSWDFNGDLMFGNPLVNFYNGDFSWGFNGDLMGFDWDTLW